MTTNVRFCLSYEPFKINDYFNRKRIVDTDVVNDVSLRAKVLLHVWSYDLYDMTLSTE